MSWKTRTHFAVWKIVSVKRLLFISTKLWPILLLWSRCNHIYEYVWLLYRLETVLVLIFMSIRPPATGWNDYILKVRKDKIPRWFVKKLALPNDKRKAEKLREKKNLPWQSQFLMSSAPIRNNFIVSSPVNLMWLIRLSFRQKKTNFYVAFRHNKLKKPSAEIKNIIIIFLQHSGGHIWPEINTESMLMNLFWLESSRHRTVCTIISRYPTRQNAGQFGWVIYIFWKLCVWWTPKSGTLPFWW